MRQVGIVLVAAAVALAGCRKGSGSGAALFLPIPPATAGNHGCNGANQPLAPPLTPVAVPLATLAIGPASQLAAAAGDVLYATGAGASIVELDFAGGSPPVETVLVAAGVVDALLAGAGIVTPAQLSGIAVLDGASLAVVEQTSNTLLFVDRTTPDTVAFLAGQPNEDPGFADGMDTLSRFAFTRATEVIPTGDGRIFIADVGNHRVRVLESALVDTVAGTGAAFFSDGDLMQTAFDTPVGLTVACTGELIVLEAGSLTGSGGHRLRSLGIGGMDFAGNLLGTSSTLAGDGNDDTVQGVDDASSLAGPVAPVTSADGEVYWIDANNGILRRYAFATGLSDCPLFADCVAAVAGVGALPNFTPGGVFSLAITDGGVLYALDATAGVLYRVGP